jgi:transaldolase
VATPAVLSAEVPHADPREVLGELAERTRLPIFASVPAVASEEIVRGARALAPISEHLILAIPFVEDAIPALRRLSSDGVRCAATLVHSVAQGLLAAKCGASLVVVPVDALEAVGEPAGATIRGLRAAFDRSAIECDVVAAGPASAARFGEVAAAGADAVVLSAATLRSFLQHPLTDRGVDRFLGDISRRARPRRAK